MDEALTRSAVCKTQTQHLRHSAMKANPLATAFIAMLIGLYLPHAAAQTGPSRTSTDNSSSTSPNLVGVRLGMQANEAIAVLKGFARPLNVELHRYNGSGQANGNGPSFRITAISAAEEVFQMVLSAPPGPSVVIAMSRTHHSNEPVLIAQVLDELRAKYGKEMTSGDTKMWFFDQSHNPVPPPKTAMEEQGYRCKLRDQWVGFEVELNTYNLSAGMGRPKHDIENDLGIHSSCGTTLQLTLSPTNNPQLASSFTMALMDYPAYYQALIAGSAYLRGLQNDHDRQEIEKAKKSGKLHL